MIRSPLRALSLALASALLLALGLAAITLAAGPVKGGTYAGSLVRGKEPITLKVSKNAKSVTVKAAYAPLYCEGGAAGTRQITKAATIAKDGSFSATIAYEFVPTHTTSTKLIVKGKFSGRKVKGSARSEFLKASMCNGSTSFSASTK